MPSTRPPGNTGFPHPQEDVQNIEAGCVPLPKYPGTPEQLCVTTTAVRALGGRMVWAVGELGWGRRKSWQNC